MDEVTMIHQCFSCHHCRDPKGNNPQPPRTYTLDLLELSCHSPLRKEPVTIRYSDFIFLLPVGCGGFENRHDGIEMEYPGHITG